MSHEELLSVDVFVQVHFILRAKKCKVPDFVLTNSVFRKDGQNCIGLLARSFLLPLWEIRVYQSVTFIQCLHC